MALAVQHGANADPYKPIIKKLTTTTHRFQKTISLKCDMAPMRQRYTIPTIVTMLPPQEYLCGNHRN